MDTIQPTNLVSGDVGQGVLCSVLHEDAHGRPHLHALGVQPARQCVRQVVHLSKRKRGPLLEHEINSSRHCCREVSIEVSADQRSHGSPQSIIYSRKPYQHSARKDVELQIKYMDITRNTLQLSPSSAQNAAKNLNLNKVAYGDMFLTKTPRLV